jgi:acyl-CoA ligase (AMP-forming) (exosortase A-associated)
MPDPVPCPLDHLPLRGQGHAPALVLGAQTLDYAALNRRIGQLAARLARHAAPGARVASWLPKAELACLLPLATARAGLVHVPVNPLLKRAQVAHILSDSEAALLIANAERLQSLRADDHGPAKGVLEHDLLAAMADDAPMPPSSAPVDALAALLYTSGSTGRPKGVMLSHANLWLGAISVAHFLRLATDDRVLAVLPLAFDYGQNQLLSAWAAGACVVPHDYLLPRDVLGALARHRITTLAGVPPLWRALAALDWPDLRDLRRLTNSGGALDAPLVRALRARAPHADLYAMYGLTEAFRSTVLDPALIDAHPTAIGSAIPFAEVLVVRADGTAAGPGEAGELVHAGPLVAQGYWRDAPRTAERFRAAPAFSQRGGIAVWSGDTVRRDAQGLLHFVGRSDALIKTAGTRVSPQEIEEAAFATGLVRDAAAFGLPHPDLGQAIHLVAVANPQADPAALAPALARDLPNFMQPRAIHWREALPLTANGKVDRAGLYRELSALRDKPAP